MPEFFEVTPLPAAVHSHVRRLIGHHPRWIRKSYRAGLERTDHYRTCSFCRCIHPTDMMALLRSGRSRLADDGHVRRTLITPNPMAGRKVRMGSIVGPVFAVDHWPIALKERLDVPASEEWDPTPLERASGHFERPAYAIAPATIAQPFFFAHTTEAQWAEIEDAISQGARHAPLQRA